MAGNLLLSMFGLESYITKDGETFYFDTETYEEGQPKLTIDYQAGDIIKWMWEGKKMIGTLRSVGFEQGLFSIELKKM